MATSWVQNTLLAGCLSLALSPLAKAGLVLVPSELPTLNVQTFVTVDFDTQAFAVGSYVPGYDFTIQSNGSAIPFSIVSSSPSSASFTISTERLGLLGTGVTVDANLVSSNPGSSFGQYAYFLPTPSVGTYYVGFQTTSDIDQNPGTTGTTYGFFEIAVGSMTVVGYGFESTPGVGAVTTPVPEPVVGTLVAAALGCVVVGRRRYGVR